MAADMGLNDEEKANVQNFPFASEVCTATLQLSCITATPAY